VKKEGYILSKETVTVRKGKETTVSMVLDKVTEKAEVSAPKTEKKAEPAYETDKTYTDPVTGMEFLFVKGSCYQMGDTFGDGYADESPVHEVCG
jgi:hypothetical protein